VGVHALISKLSFRSDQVGFLVKGGTETLVENGKINRKAMAKAKITEKDLLEEARLNGRVNDVNDIQLATLERNGTVSVIPRA